MYLEAFGLKIYPFANTADPRFFFATEAHEEALANMTYAVEQGKGMVMVTGEVGTGKTLVSHVLSLRLRRECVLATIQDPLLRGEQFLRSVYESLAGPPARRMGRMDLQSDLRQRLINVQRTGRRVAVLVDEAQDLCPGALEQLRLLSNWEFHSEKLIQWVLVGQPELRAKLLEPRWQHLRQRVVLSFHLTPLQTDQAGPYIRHRLRVAAGGLPPRVSFDESAIARIAEAAGGAVRLINNLCDAALLAAFAQDRAVVTGELIEAIAGEMTTVGWGNSRQVAEDTNTRTAA